MIEIIEKESQNRYSHKCSDCKHSVICKYKDEFMAACNHIDSMTTLPKVAKVDIRCEYCDYTDVAIKRRQQLG